MNTIGEDMTRVIDLADMLAILLAQPDAETAVDGMHKVAQIISEHARSALEQFEARPASMRPPTLSVVQRLDPSDRA